MLQEEETTTWFEHPMDFVQRLVYILDTAEGERADYAVEGIVSERKPLAADNPLVHFDTHLSDPFLRPPAHPRVRIDNRDFADVFGIAWQVQAGPEADFQDVAAGVGKQFSPVLRHERFIQQKITKARKDNLRVEAHGFLLVLPH